ncbi:pirin family protein [Pseudomonas sp. nanlin1]|uniref:pirin family protein n=1 Tax=Pseudomonas sp. nanlin1 TaxID=3040605 RepID=UPI00388EF2F6
MTSRNVTQQYPALRDDIADLSTRRPLPGPGLEQLDPFLFLNHHGPQVYPPANQGLPFGPHPHRGFETITFILTGELAHLDSGGHESVIRAGGVQWMTAGAGVVHAELSPASFKHAGGPLEILQLWLNLPGKLKMTAPAYTGLQADAIPVLQLDQGRARVHLVSGEVAGQRGPFQSLTDTCLMSVQLSAGAEIELPAPLGRQVFLYVVDGDQVSVAGTALNAQHLVALDDSHAGVRLTSQGDATLLYGHAAPLNEPVVSYGPFVMNTQEEIRQAVVDYRAGKFGEVPGH